MRIAAHLIEIIPSSPGNYFPLQGKILNVYGNYSSRFYSTRFADKSVGPVPLGGYFRIDLNTGYILGREDNWRIYFLVKNLLNRKYSTVVGYPDPGRRFHLGVEYHFIRKKRNEHE